MFLFCCDSCIKLRLKCGMCFCLYLYIVAYVGGVRGFLAIGGDYRMWNGMILSGCPGRWVRILGLCGWI